jgi:hypothetical protein
MVTGAKQVVDFLNVSKNDLRRQRRHKQATIIAVGPTAR